MDWLASVDYRYRLIPTIEWVGWALKIVLVWRFIGLISFCHFYDYMLEKTVYLFF